MASYAANIVFVFAWIVCSFMFWRGLRRFAVIEDRIFDLTFYATVIGFVVSRAGYVATHWTLFAGKSMLLVAALWISPGLSWLGLLLGGLITLIYLSRRYKVRLGLVLDTVAFSLPLPIILGEAASLLNGVEIGKITTLPWAIRFVGFTGMRHPVQLYEMVFLVLISTGMLRITQLAARHKWAYGIIGVWFFFFYSFFMFVLEFLKDSPVYWGRLTANQWMLIGIFAECVGVIYVRGGGREAIRRVRNNIYESISKRHAR